MSKGSFFPVKFWDSPIWETLKTLRDEHLRVYLLLVHGPTSEVSSIYRVSVAQIAEDAGLDPDTVRQVIAELCDTGWCEYEHPVLWIVGAGNINDKLGTKDFRGNASWLRATEKHLDSLPPNRLVDAFRRHHGLVAVPSEGVNTVLGGSGHPYSSSSCTSSLSSSSSSSSSSGPHDCTEGGDS